MNAPVTLARSAGRILPDTSKPTYEQLLKIIADQQAALAAKPARSISLKISTKGALSIYGLGRFPMTLYVSQFDKLALAWPDVIDFVHDHRSELSVKD